MGENSKEKKTLKLNKETLMRLQEQQLKAAIGGAELMSFAFDSGPCITTSCPDCPPPDSCCRKSCKGGGHKDLV